MNQAFQYQRLILAYHGCDKAVADEVLIKGSSLKSSQKSYDWLGNGIYFWEHGPERALEWAQASKNVMRGMGQEVPKNESLNPDDRDLLLRRLDCSVLNWALDSLDQNQGNSSYDSVRGLFQEDEPAFEGSAIKLKSHIQIAVRNPSCILGYFRPS